MDEKQSVIRDGMVVVDKNKIAAVGTEAELKDKYEAGETIDAGNGITMPGMINTHTHAAMSYFRGLADDLPLSDWLEEHIWPAEAKFVNADFVRRASELAILEMIKSGITCFNDMYFFEEAVASVAKTAGIRAVIGEGILDFPSPSAKTPAEAIKKTAELISEFKNEELITAAFAPHSVYACGEECLVKIKELAEKYNALIHIHVAETKKEADDCREKYGRSPVEYLNSLGFLSPRVIAAHSVWLDENDLCIYKERGVKVSHNPVSNMKLASGVAPIPAMLKKGIIVGLGTDGAASNNTLDMFSEMRAASLLHKTVNMDPTVLSARETVKMATIDAARVLGLDGKTGSLEAGKRADFITINLDKPHLAPMYDPYSHLVYCANAADVDNVVINGKIIMRNRVVKTMEEERILAEANEFSEDKVKI
ncbi:MAG: amidohydrolase [Candidatus Falkowbacteria bacterium]